MWNGEAVVVPVGSDKQADIPPMTESACAEEDRDECVWRTRNGVDENALQCFYNASKAKLDATDSVRPDDALYMLMKNDYDFQQATAQIKNGNKQSDETWTDEDQEALGLAFGVVEKNFTALARMFPGKSSADIAERYYNTKKTVDYRGLRDDSLQEEHFNLRPQPLNLKSIPSKDSDARVAGSAGGTCQNCGLEDVTVYPVKKTQQCLACRNFFKVTKKHRPCRQIPGPDGTDDMDEVAEEFLGMSLTTGADLKDDGDVLGPITRSKARLRAMTDTNKDAKTTSERSEDETKQDEQGSKGADETVSKAPDVTAGVKKTSERPTITDVWSKKEKDTVSLCLSTGHHEPAELAKILGSKTEAMVVKYLNEQTSSGKEVYDKMTGTKAKNVPENNKEEDAVEKQDPIRAKKPPAKQA